MKAQKNGSKHTAKANTATNTDGNPYMAGGLRAAIFELGSKGYASRAELSAAAAKVKRTTADKASFQVAVCANHKHPGQNGGKQGGRGKSKEVVKGGKRFLVAV